MDDGLRSSRAIGPRPGTAKALRIRSGLLRAAELAAVLALLGFAYLRGIEGVPFHGDESHWISTSYFLESFLAGRPGPPRMSLGGVPGGFKAPAWVMRSLQPGAGPSGVWSAYYWTLTQPPLTRYTIGLGRLIAGYSAIELNGPWDFQLSHEANASMGCMPSPGLLLASRSIMALLALASGLLLFIVLKRASGGIAAWSFLVLFSASDYLHIHLRRAMSESPLLFWTSLSLALGALALTASENDGQWGAKGPGLLWLPLMGGAAGMAGAAKLNGLALGAGGAILACAIAWRRRKIPCPRLLRSGAYVAWAAPLVLAATAALFIAVNPFLYYRPIARSYAMYLFRLWEMAGQAANPQWRIPGLAARLSIVPQRILKDYALIKLPALNLILACLGIYALGRSAWRWLAGKPDSPSIRVSAASTAILVLAACLALPPLASPLDWDRYYLFPVIFTTVFIGAGIGFLLRALRAFIEGRRGRGKAGSTEAEGAGGPPTAAG
jgi:hypothetical protein